MQLLIRCAGYPESCSMPNLQSTQILPFDPTTQWSPLASCCSLHPKWWYWPARPSKELDPSTYKHQSDHTPEHEHITPRHQLASWYCHRWEQTNVAQWSLTCSDFTSTPHSMTCNKIHFRWILKVSQNKLLMSFNQMESLEDPSRHVLGQEDISAMNIQCGLKYVK